MGGLKIRTILLVIFHQSTLGKPLHKEKLKTKMESSNLSPNCIFMKTKKCNKKLGTTLGDPLRHQNHELKEIQKLHA